MYLVCEKVCASFLYRLFIRIFVNISATTLLVVTMASTLEEITSDSISVVNGCAFITNNLLCLGFRVVTVLFHSSSSLHC